MADSSLSPQESYDMLEIVEARCHKSTIFCTQYESEGWYTRIDPNPESDSPVSEAIMDRIIHNAYEVLVDGRVSMRERKGLEGHSGRRWPGCVTAHIFAMRKNVWF